MVAIAEAPSVATSTEGRSQFLAFSLGNQEFGIDILRVQEIKNYTRVTPLPNAPDCIQGVINLRGAVIPIIDLRRWFNMSAADHDRFTVIIVVNMGEKVAGLIVDSVSDVLQVGADQIEEAPTLAQLDTSFIQGLAKSGERLVVLLDLEQLVQNRIPAEATSLAN